MSTKNGLRSKFPKSSKPNSREPAIKKRAETLAPKGHILSLKDLLQETQWSSRWIR